MKNIISLKQTNTVQSDKTSSNWNNGESDLPQDIENWILASNMDLLSVMESFSPPKRRAWVVRESFLSKIRLSISLILLVRVNLWLEKWVHWRKKCAVNSAVSTAT